MERRDPEKSEKGRGLWERTRLERCGSVVKVVIDGEAKERGRDGGGLL